MKKLIKFLVFEFWDGGHTYRYKEYESAAAALEFAKMEILLRGEFTEVAKTDVIVGPNPPSMRERTHPVNHSLAHLERSQPNTVFVGVIEEEAFRQQEAAADAEEDEYETILQRRIREATPLSVPEIRFQDLPSGWRTRIRVTKWRCWVWVTAKDAPYRRIYLKLRGPIPEEAVLRHYCDNRHCVNPNHLIPGTARENVRDMLERGRHWQQMRNDPSLAKQKAREWQQGTR